MSRTDEFRVTVSKDALLAKLVSNREAHITRFAAATVAFKKKQLEVLADLLARAQADKEVNAYKLASLATPVEYTENYDRVIGMLNMSNESALALSETQYSQYVLDEWTWQERFDTISSSYGC